MAKKKSIGNKMSYEDELLESLLKDPTKSIREIGKELNSYRQKIWRKKKKLENENVIWGYTAVVDESRMNHVMYIVLLKLKPMNQELADIMVERIIKKIPQKQQVHQINVLYINGQYDLIVMFTSPNHSTARRYYDSIRSSYEDFLLEKPVIVDVNFSLIREGKINPELKNLYDFIPL